MTDLSISSNGIDRQDTSFAAPTEDQGATVLELRLMESSDASGSGTANGSTSTDGGKKEGRLLSICSVDQPVRKLSDSLHGKSGRSGGDNSTSNPNLFSSSIGQETEGCLVDAIRKAAAEEGIDSSNAVAVQQWAEASINRVGDVVKNTLKENPQLLLSTTMAPQSGSAKGTPQQPPAGGLSPFAGRGRRKKRVTVFDEDQEMFGDIDGHTEAIARPSIRKKSVFAINSLDVSKKSSVSSAHDVERGSVSSRKSIMVGAMSVRSGAGFSGRFSLLSASASTHLTASSRLSTNEDEKDDLDMSSASASSADEPVKQLQFGLGVSSRTTNTAKPPPTATPAMNGHVSDARKSDVSQATTRMTDFSDDLEVQRTESLIPWGERKEFATEAQALFKRLDAKWISRKDIFLLCWMIFTIANAIIVPIRVAIGSHQIPEWVQWLELAFDVPFILSLGLNLKLPLEDLGRHEYNRTRLWDNYIGNFAFVFDLVAMFPLQMILLPLVSTGAISSLGTDFARVNRLLYLVRLDRLFNDVAERFLPMVHPLVHRLVKFVLVFVLYGIITAAPIHMVVRSEPQVAREWFGIRHTDNDAVLYLSTLLYAVGISAGRNYPYPKTEKQHLVMIFVSFFGMGSMAVLITGVQSMILSLVERGSKLQNKIEDAQVQMTHMRLSDELIREVTSYYTYMFHNFNTFDYSTSNDMFDEVPLDLREYIEDHVNSEIIRSVPLFGSVTDPTVIREIAAGLDMYVVMPGTIVCKEGEEGDDMYFIAKGTAQAVVAGNPERDGDEDKVDELGEGDFFGEAALLFMDVYHATVTAQTVAQIFALNKVYFDLIVDKYPELLEPIVESAKAIHEHRANNDSMNHSKSMEKSFMSMERTTANLVDQYFKRRDRSNSNSPSGSMSNYPTGAALHATFGSSTAENGTSSSNPLAARQPSSVAETKPTEPSNGHDDGNTLHARQRKAAERRRNKSTLSAASTSTRSSSAGPPDESAGV